MSSPQIHHDPERHLFEATGEGHAAHLEYREQAGVLTILHTIVPTPLGGQGLGGRLVDAALAYAKSRGLRMVSECWYASRHMAAQDAAGEGDAGR